jgi:hypothetical protein
VVFKASKLLPRQAFHPRVFKNVKKVNSPGEGIVARDQHRYSHRYQNVNPYPYQNVNPYPYPHGYSQYMS